MDHDEHRWPGDRRTKQAAYPIELKNDMASGNDSSQGKEGREGEREEERQARLSIRRIRVSPNGGPGDAG